MGIIIGRFRKSKSTYEVLENLEKQITSIEEFGRNTEMQKKRIIGRFILLAILAYLILAVILYVYYNKIAPNRGLIYIILLIAFPIVIYFVKNFLAWYYSRKLKKNEKKLVKLKEEKKKILENVMETETYKVAKKILDKFGNETKKPLISTDLTPHTKTNVAVSSVALPSSTVLRQRNAPVIPRNRLSFGSRDDSSPHLLKPTGHVSSTTAMVPKSGMVATPRLGIALPPSMTPAQLPKEIIPRDRSILDKMVDYLLSDGPSNRYALICKKCFSHNGMALKEEFEYFAFKCCYCGHFNPARKKRFITPSFEHKPSPAKTLTPDSSESDHSSLEPDEEAYVPLVTEPKEDLMESISRTESLNPFESSDQVDVLSEGNIQEGEKDSGIQETLSLMRKDEENMSSLMSKDEENMSSLMRKDEENMSSNSMEVDNEDNKETVELLPNKNPFDSDTTDDPLDK